MTIPTPDLNRLKLLQVEAWMEPDVRFSDWAKVRTNHKLLKLKLHGQNDILNEVSVWEKHNPRQTDRKFFKF